MLAFYIMIIAIFIGWIVQVTRDMIETGKLKKTIKALEAEELMDTEIKEHLLYELRKLL